MSFSLKQSEFSLFLPSQPRFRFMQKNSLEDEGSQITTMVVATGGADKEFGYIRDSKLTIVGKSNNVNLKVSKTLLTKSSDILKELFDGINLEGDDCVVELEEEYSIQLASYIESLHPDSSEPLASSLSRLVWNTAYAKLACKYLIPSHVEQYAELANDLLAEYAGLNVTISYDGNPAINGLYRCKGSYYQQVNGPYSLRPTDSYWAVFMPSNANLEIVLNIPTQVQTPARPSSTINIPYFTSDRFFTFPFNATIHWVFKLDFEVKFSYNKPFEIGVPVHENKTKFWSIVDAVLTHDGLKLPNGLLRNQEDLMHLLTARKPYHLWDAQNINKFLSLQQVFDLYYSAGRTST